MTYSAKSDAAGTINQFTRRKDIKITTGGTSTPANYQVKVTVAYEPAMQSTFADIRFNTKAGNYIDYWIESKTDGVTADVWLELPDAIADPGSDTIWMYYGNPALSDGGNGVNTFIDFWNAEEAAQLDDWPAAATYTQVQRSATQARQGTYSFIESATGDFSEHVETYELGKRYVIYFYDDATITTKSGLILLGGSGDDYIILGVKYDTSTTKYSINVGAAAVATIVSRTTGWHKFEIVEASGANNVMVLIDDIQVATTTHTSSILQIKIGDVWNHGAGPFYFDDIFVSNYIANEPTAAVGTAQHQRRVPTFL